MDSIFQLAKGLGDCTAPMFRHMSQPARQILAEAARALLNSSVGRSKHVLMAQFMETYSPMNYERIALQYDVFGLCKALGRLPRNIKDANLIIGYTSLARIDKLEEMFPNQVIQNKGGPVALPESFVRVYDFLVDEFLLDDFSATDLRKMVELAKDNEFRTIASVAKLVHDLHKHTVSFLASAVRHETAVGKARDGAALSLNDRSQQELQKLVKLFADGTGMPESPRAYDPNWHKDLDVDMAMDEEARLLKDKE